MTQQVSPVLDSRAFVANVSHSHSPRNFLRNEIVFSQESPADAVFYISKGMIKISVASKQGKEAVVAILGPGEFFGEGCLIGQWLRLATARTMIESEVIRFDKTEMIRALHAEPAFSELFMAHLLMRNSRAEEDLVDQLFNSSEKRLARTLLFLASFRREGGSQPITTPISQETLAKVIGTTRPRVSHFMNKFRKLGFIDYDSNSHSNKHLQIHDSLLSVVLHD